MGDFDVNKIVDYLEDYKSDEYELKLQHYWEERGKIDFEGISGFEGISKIDKKEKIKRLSQEIELKKWMKDWFSNLGKEDPNYEKLCRWIIQKWGRIRRSDETITKESIDDFFKPKRNEYKFPGIASMSKVASFIDPTKYSIYDSRVIHSLNWIILSQDAGNRFFPMPEGQNSKINAFDLETLIRLKNIDKYQKSPSDRNFMSDIDKEIFIEKKRAYAVFNELIKEINEKLWKEDTEKAKNLYYTEMLLFIIADKDIYQDITSKVSINLNSPCQK